MCVLSCKIHNFTIPYQNFERSDPLGSYGLTLPNGTDWEWLKLVWIYGEINCFIQIKYSLSFFSDELQMWVNLTNSEQFIISCCIVRTVKIVCLTVCWLFDWTASQLVEFLYWFCLTEYIIWNWKWCYLYCLTSVMQGNRLEESDWIPQQLFYCFSYILIYDVNYNLLLIVCVWTILNIVIWYDWIPWHTGM